MDEYERKFAAMQKYIPFLEAMIERLKKVKDQSRASQLQKMQSLHGILSDSKRKLKLETLQRCEEVLQKLHSKVEKGNPSAPKSQSIKNTENAKSDNSGHLQPKIECSTENADTKETEMRNKVAFAKRMEDDETPASPSPPASPDQAPDPKSVKPIIIPTERNDGFTGTIADDRPASPDACEMIRSIGPRTPIIIPTERENPLRKVDPDPTSQRIPTWTYLDSISTRVAQITNAWQSNSSSRGANSRPRVIRHIPTIPILSKGTSGSVLRKPVLVLDKNNTNPEIESPTSKFDSPSSIPEFQILSPDRDSHMSRSNKTSPKGKDLPPIPKLSSTALLVAPPPVLTVPPLTSEDIAELLQDEGDRKDDKRSEISSKDDESRSTGADTFKHDTRRGEKESDGKSASASKKDEKSSKNPTVVHLDVDRDNEKRWEEVDKPIVKMHAHQTNRRLFTSPTGASGKHGETRGLSSSLSVVADRSSDPRNRPPSPIKDRDIAITSEIRLTDNYEKHPRQSRDNHKQNVQMDANPSAFPRNSEVAARANSEERGASALYHRRPFNTNVAVYQDLDPRRDKSVEFYKNVMQREREREREREQERQRERDREIQREREREMQRERERDMQREREIERELMAQTSGRGMIHQSPVRGGTDVCNQPQWNQNMNYPQGLQGPGMYPQQQRQDRWMPGGPGNNNVPMDAHMMSESGGGHMRTPQYQGPPNSCGRPMLSPQDMNLGPCMDMNMGGPRMDPGCMDMNMGGPRMDSNCMDMNMGPRMDPAFRDDMPNPNVGPQSMGPQQHPNAIPQLMQNAAYPMGPQYHQFPQENRPNVQQYDRQQDFTHNRQPWDQSGNRPNDSMPYPRPQGPSGPSQGQWNRPNRGGSVPQSVPPPLITPPLTQAAPAVQGNRNFNDRGRGSGESSRNPPYKRDPRDSRDHRDSRDPRDPRDSRDPRESRDPRVRADASPNATNLNNSTTGTAATGRREYPRFTPKESPQPSVPAPKPREIPSANDRNQRRRTNDPKDIGNKHHASKEKEIDREQIRKRDEKRRDPKSDRKVEKECTVTKNSNEKAPKDIMQSPLESLYGVIDTTAKTGKGYGLQKFKIPKIRKTSRAPTPPKAVDETAEENWDAPDENSDCVITHEKSADVMEIPQASNRKEMDDKKSEVTSTTSEIADESPQIVEAFDCASQSKETTAESSETEKIATKLLESEQLVATSTINTETVNPSGKEPEAAKLKEEVTQELIQALIRKSLESGEVKELFESKLMQKFGEAFQGKKFKKILNIIDSDSASSSDKEEPFENKKIGAKKKRRVIVSDSSDEECLAERLGKIDTLETDDNRNKETGVDEVRKENESDETKRKEVDDEEKSTADKAADLSDGGSTRDKQDTSSKKGKRAGRKKRERKTKTAISSKEATTGEIEPPSVETTENQVEERSEISPKNQSAKPKPKRRNSLEMLQEDIREMFISEGVVTATGHRMCRLIKEAQENLTAPVDSQAKKSWTGSLDRQSARNESDFEGEAQRPLSANSRGRGGRSKGGRRTRCRTRSRKSLKEIASSDSETEDSHRTEVTAANENTGIEKKLGEKTSETNNSKSKDDTETSHFLRRSERVGLRESTKGGNEKADFSKMESSKTMFDSSSDESFGIDVSELTAAVDISLHPDSRGRITSSSPVPKGSTSAKSTTTRKPRSAKAKEINEKSEKNDNAASCDEIDSLASDLSRASSLTRGKKANSNDATKQDTNEELMSDLLVGLVNAKLPGSSKSIDGDTENRNDTAPASELKNFGRRKKKKKGCWAMGIVKKKKRLQSPVTTTPSTELESTFEHTRDDVPLDEANKTKLEDASLNPETKEEILSDVSFSKPATDVTDNTDKEDLVIDKVEPCSPVKSIASTSTTNANLDDTNDDKTPLEQLLMDEKTDDENVTAVNPVATNKLFDLETLLSCTWTPKKDRFNCLYCSWQGKNIVHHYTIMHGDKEMILSRLPVEKSAAAIQEAQSGGYDLRIPKAVTKTVRKFQCRFCAFQTVGAPAQAVEAFYEHCTTHTGEYRFQCRSCTYRTVARSSMRTHCSRRRNNPCRINYVNTFMTITGDPVPEDDFLYGHMCTICNFLQLKRSNVEKHLQRQHEDKPDAAIVKIDMSSYLDDDLYSVIDEAQTKVESKQEEVDPNEPTDQGESLSREPSEASAPIQNITEALIDPIDVVEGNLKNEDLKREDDPPDLSTKTTVDRSEAPTPPASLEIATGNLNAFVCPPELENKENEIQLERQKKMQEIVKNIGLSNNLSEKRDLSIIDKLKDKMTENVTDEVDESEAEAIETPEESKVLANEEVLSGTLPVLLPESVKSLATGDEFSKTIQELPDDPIKREPEDCPQKSPDISQDDVETDKEDKSDKKMKDPLATLAEVRRDAMSGDEDADEDDDEDVDESDVETIPEQPPPPYETDTSSEQSDTEISADVNSLLEETFSINTTANAPMMTTIQRLAAKLQGEKPFPGTSGNANVEKIDEADQKATADSTIPKKPNAIPISSIQRFLDRRNAVLQEVVKEIGEFSDKDSDAVASQPLITLKPQPSSPQKSPLKTPPKSPMLSGSPPKKFIRLRRLSGDKLSVPSPIETPLETPAVVTPLGISRSSSIDGSTSDVIGDILQTDTEEECSFLRIENVVSLAPGIENKPSETTMDDIRKAVANTSMKSPVSLLKKSSPNILKRSNPGGTVTSVTVSSNLSRPATTMSITNLSVKPVGSMTTSNIPVRPVPIPGMNIPIRPAPTKPISPVAVRSGATIAAVSGASPRPAAISAVPVSGISGISPTIKQNFKIVKVVRGLTLLKQKDSMHRVYGNKFKTPVVLAIMLQHENLQQFYKCMSSVCSYTTDCQQSFGRHYRWHKENVDRSQGVMNTYDFQRCPYCFETLTTWNAMSEHLKDKHVYCQYQCGYCFYRGLAQSYVELHQAAVHQGLPISVLLGQRESSPIEVIDRREFVIPFVCQHECGKSFYVPGAFLAHLRTKHGNSLSIFKCHLCPAPSVKAEQLIAHYKLHGIYKYQCIYCLFGSEQTNDLHVHLSASHYNRPPRILERTLQPCPVRDKDVLQQLLVINLDESYTCSDITLVPGQDPVDIPKRKHNFLMDRNDTSAIVGDITLPIGNIGMSRLFSNDKVDPNETTPSTPSSPGASKATPLVTQVRKISPKKSSDNVLVVDDAGVIRKSTKAKDIVDDTPAKSSSPEKKIATVLKTTACSSSSASGLQCNDEFVNFNILDNPEFLKVAENKNSPNSCAKPFDVLDDDSDIEILEDIAVTPKKSSTANKSDITKSEPLKENVIAMKEEFAAPVVTSTDSQNLGASSSSEDSQDINAETNANTPEAEANADRPLTLDDIRGTGFTGVQLYRCGYDGCEYGAENSSLLRTHIKECFYASETKCLNCVHCNKRFVKTGFLVEHFKLHGLKRFGCSMCKDRWPMPYQAMSHMKSKHKQTYTKLIPADPKNPSADGLFVVEPIPTNGTSRSKKRGRVKSSEKEAEKSGGDTEKISFGPTDIESLPRPAIYQREVQCAVCPYTTKVRTNIIRHLQLHAKDETVPESGPVNPVPCLDKKERMFDKMVNLASSSHQNGRMGGKPVTKDPTIDSDAELLPKFIPEHKRYVCGVTDCNYLTCDESMLRYHLKALHPDELHFRCPHCPAPAPGHETQNVAIDKMAVHLKMHDSRLYKCSHCNNHHYHRHVVERHLSDKHPDASPYVKVIREPETTESVQQPGAQEDGEEGTADTDGNHWKCNLCDYKCVYKTEMVTHAASSHEEKGQFKCNACSYKTNNKISFDQHVNAKHPYDLNADCILTYQKIKGVGLKKPAADSSETGNPDEPFDTTPLWRRDMPRVRHIRGILFEDEKPEGKSNKRKSDTDLPARPAKIKPGKSTVSETSSADRDSDSIWNGNVSENSSTDPTLDIAESFREAEPGGSTFTKVDMAKLTRKFGPLGSALAVFYRCTICQTFKTKYKHDMRDHLYRDLKYWRYRCILCGYMAVNKTATSKHFEKNHEPRRPTDKELETLPVDHELETWVQALLKSQTNQMRGFVTGADGNALQDTKLRRGSNAAARQSSTENNKKVDTDIPEPTLKDTNKKPKTAELPGSSTETKKKAVTKVERSKIDDILIDVEGNSSDFDALVIDNKEDLEEEELASDSETTSHGEAATPKVSFTCKHCDVKIGTVQGFKLHVELRHLRRNPFLCAYCDTSVKTEIKLLRHLRKDHGDRPPTVIANPVTNPPDLPPDFWEREYQLMSRDSLRKRKRNDEEAGMDPFEKTPGVFHVCNKCGFRAINYFGLSVHMRKHAAPKDHKCAYCSYAARTQTELWQHSEINHADLDWKVGNGDVAISGKPEMDKSEMSVKERGDENYEDYEVTASTSGTSGSYIVPKADMIYSCFYCDSGNTTLEGVKEHWKMEHRSTTKTPGDGTMQRVVLPFRYKEIPSNTGKTTLRCGYCPKRGTAAQIRLHTRKKHGSRVIKFVEVPLQQLGWICQWCKDVCENEAEKKVHHNLLHSHLVPSFKRQESNPIEAPGSECPECPFRTTSRAAMEKHFEKHVDSVICKRCGKTFRDVSIGIMHNTQAHAGEVSKIEGFKTNIEKMMARVKWRNDGDQDRNTFETVARSALDNTWKNCGVARKSTTKSILSVVHPKPTGVKAVARKSTNPLPRYPPGMRFATTEDADSKNDDKREQCISYYGKPIVPVNLANINTYITLSGGRRMKLTCSALAQLIDIEPNIIVKNFKRDSKKVETSNIA